MRKLVGKGELARRISKGTANMQNQGSQYGMHVQKYRGPGRGRRQI